MEIISTNYNCRNRIVAGFLPILDEDRNEAGDQVDGQFSSKLSQSNIKSAKNLHFFITTTNCVRTASSLRTTFSQISAPTTIYQIDVSKVSTTPRLYSPTLNYCASSSRQAQSSNSTTKSKKTLRNKRQKAARRRRRNQRHVHFPEQDDLIAIVIVIEDDDCIKEYRNKYWEIFAIDRKRFQDRISRMASALEPVLKSSHREKIYKERFSSYESEEEEKDSGCDSTNDSDQGKENQSKKSSKNNVKNNVKLEHKKRSTSRTLENGESGFNNETSESECESECDDDNENEISVSITIQSTRFDFYTPS